ncbi:armadillo-type protein [Xylariaceae sp. FL0016]|nr:armadillo-type protein [Xylariaceae sp. FL0016]
MASFENQNPALRMQTGSSRPPQVHQRSKSNVLSSFIHRRNGSAGSALPPAELTAPSYSNFQTSSLDPSSQRDMGFLNFSRPAALGEIQQNQVGGAPRSPSKQYERPPSAPRSPSKTTFGTLSIKSNAFKETEKIAKQSKEKDDEKIKPKKTRSTTNLGALLSRPKSLKNLQKIANEDEQRFKRDKENRTPTTPQEATRPPIYAHYCSGALDKLNGVDNKDDVFGNRYVSNGSSELSAGSGRKIRPQSYHASTNATKVAPELKPGSNRIKSSPTKRRGLGIFTSGRDSKDKPTLASAEDFSIDPKDINSHLEAMLDRRNIPENQRYKMRNLADTIKMEFIRQDWAESRGVNNVRSGSPDSDLNKDNDDSKTKKTRGRSFTLSRNRGPKSESTSPVKKSKGEGTLGRHFRSRSTESVASERPTSSGSGAGSSILSKIKLQQGPADYVSYLRKVQKPEVVEVGKLHKLRLLLRNETVAWTEEFIRQGGLEEIVGLLHRIMDVEWREEHEDALLHENLLCLKALCTIALAMQYLHSIQGTLFPALLHMIFDPEKKGPNEFSDRNIITSILFMYIQSASIVDRPIRAKTVLGHLRDPEPKEDQRPVGFVLEMHRERPYRVWCKECTGVTKEVFWIFLHALNVVYLPRDKEPKGDRRASGIDSLAYMQTHFPQERAPIAAAPYVGGVEWDATNYLASHLDLLNAILACTPTAQERNALRDLFKISGWERMMGGSLRLCKEKFYPFVHESLRTWVSAAVEDGWDVKDVRYGPPAQPKSPSKKATGAGAKQVKDDKPPPKIEMPKLDFGHGNGMASPLGKPKDDWLS